MDYFMSKCFLLIYKELYVEYVFSLMSKDKISEEYVGVGKKSTIRFVVIDQGQMCYHWCKKIKDQKSNVWVMTKATWNKLCHCDIGHNAHIIIHL